jgi:hypothetical protein
MSIFAKLGVVMTVDSAPLQKGLSDATISSRAFQAELKKQQRESAQFAKEAGEALSKVALIATVAGAAILKAFSYADQIADTADSIDITVESLIRFSKALELSGGEADSIEKLFGKLNVAQDKAREGADDVRDAFKRLGVSAGEVQNLAPDKLFERVAQELSKVADPATRNAQAFELLGKAAKGVDWKAYWKNYGEGKAVSKETAEAIQAGANAWDNLKIAGTTALNAILILAKPVADLINRLAEIVKQNESRKDTYSDNFAEAKKRLETDQTYLDASLAKRREMIELKVKEIELEKQQQKVIDENKLKQQTTSLSNTGYAKGSTKETSLGEKQKLDRVKSMEDFSIELEKIKNVDKQIDRTEQLIGMGERAQEIKKMQWALDDENTRVQLALRKELDIETAKSIDQDKIKIDLLKLQSQLYSEAIAQAKISGEQEIIDKENKIRKQQILTNTEKDAFQTSINNMATLAQKNRTAFVAWKAMAIAMATIDTYQSAGAVFKSTAEIPVVGAYLAYPAAALAVAAGLARVATIAGTEFQGRAKGGAIVANTPYMVGESGPELVIPHNGGTVIPNNQLSNHLGGGAQTVINGPYIQNMSAIDTQSAFQFLSRNKDAVWSANQSASRSLPASR